MVGVAIAFEYHLPSQLFGGHLSSFALALDYENSSLAGENYQVWSANPDG